MTDNLKSNLEQAPAKPHKNTPNQCNVEKAIRQRIDKGMTLQEIADCQGVNKSSISRLLSKVNDVQLLAAYKNKRQDVYTLLEGEILESVQPDDIKSASLLQRVTAAGILKTHYNLEAGKATEIIDVRSLDISGTLAELRQAVEANKKINIEESEVVDA